MDKEATRAKLDELLRLATPANSTVRLTTTTVALERVPMSMDEKMDARKRFVSSPSLPLSLSLLVILLRNAVLAVSAK